VAFSRDGHRLVTGGDDSTVRLWNAGTGKPLSQPFTGHINKIESVAFSPDGNLVASASDDALVGLWQAQVTPDMLCDKLTGNMSHKQWQDWVSPDIGYQTLCPGLPVAP
jgi:WD40 repeat protein